MKNYEITLEVCSNTEWLREMAGLDLDAIPDGCENEAAETLHRDVTAALERAGYNVENAKGQRCTFHGWNGANTFQHLLGMVGTCDSLTTQQQEEILRIIGTAKDDIEFQFSRA